MGEPKQFLNFKPYELHLRILLGLVSFCALSVLSWFELPRIAEALLPAIHAVLQLISSELDPMQLSICKPKSEWLICLEAVNANTRAFGQNLLPAGIPIQVSTLAGHLVQPVIVILALCPLLPAKSLAEQMHHLIFALLFCCIIVLLDTPFVLIGAIEELILSTFEPDKISVSLLCQWMFMMNSGGRLFLGLLALPLILLCSRWLQIRFPSFKTKGLENELA